MGDAVSVPNRPEPDEIVARLEVERLLTRYTALGDAGRAADFAALFAPDGVLDIAGRRLAVGPEGVRAFAEEAGAAMRSVPGLLPGGHHVSSRLVDLAGPGEARSSSVFLFVGASGLDHWGTYRDRLVLTADGWRFTRRGVRFTGFAPESGAAAVFDRLTR
jgi:hypothetical protein